MAASSPKVIKCPPSTALERFVGLIAASVFSLTYYFAPLYVLTAPLVLWRDYRSTATWVYLAPLIISTLLPCRANKPVLYSWFMSMTCRYFNYTEILEYTDEEVVAYSEKRPLILVVCPHGVLSFVGICSGLVDYAGEMRRRLIIDRFPTAVASVVMKMPILKHVIGIFGLIDASKKSLTKQLSKGGSFVLYPGGIAELFLCSPKEEKILLRKGFIKLALTTGADVIPLYLFGNTTVLHLVKHRILRSLSRNFGISLTLFWGRWGLPVPFDDQLIYVRGKPIGLPKIESPTNEDVDKWHAKYAEELTRLFDTYKHMRPDYQNKKLTIIEDEKEGKAKRA